MNISKATSKTSSFVSATLLSIVLSACGGGATQSDGTVSGTVTGLGSGLSLVLQNNGGETVSVTNNGTFAFPTKLVSLGAFNITVLTQPIGQSCTLSRATGVIPTDGNQANTTVVTCSANSLGATVSGLATGNTVTLSNAATQIVVNANGVSTFPGILVANTSYAVSIAVQPTNQVCTLANASGAIASGVQSLVTLTCI
jgi:hypothetical protein